MRQKLYLCRKGVEGECHEAQSRSTLNVRLYLNGNQDFGDCQTRDPIVLLNGINANVSMSADVWVKNSCQEPDFRWIEGVGEWNLKVEVEDATFIGTSHRSCD